MKKKNNNKQKNPGWNFALILVSLQISSLEAVFFSSPRVPPSLASQSLRLFGILP